MKGILQRDYDFKNTPSLEPFIASASVIVDQVVVMAAQKNKSMPAPQLELIERWLSAHMYCMNDRVFASKSQGGASASFAGSLSEGFDATLYGQTAQRIDTSNCLTNIDKKQYASMTWLGKPPSAQIPYNNRD